MRLLVDTDLFCKLGVTGLIDPVLAALGVNLADCRRLAALPHMLRRGKLRTTYGQERCEALVPLAEAIAPAPAAAIKWLDPLTPVTGVDPGEAQLLALAAEFGLLFVTGDKRALRSISSIVVFHAALAGKLVTFEALLLLLLQRLGVDALRASLTPLDRDQVVKICFSPSNADPGEGLRSYFNTLKEELQPLRLWDPFEGGVA